jgi:hypothetical protein
MRRWLIAARVAWPARHASLLGAPVGSWALLALLLAGPALAAEPFSKLDRLPPVLPDVKVTGPSLLEARGASGDVVPLDAGALHAVDYVYLNGDYSNSNVVPSSGLLDNIDAFVGLDGSKQPQDFGINAQFGGRTSVNVGIPLWGSLGLQIGTAIDATADAVQVVQAIEGSAGRTQSFTTFGLFQRTESGFSWGVVYDYLYENYYDEFTLGQWRVNLGYQLTERSTVGVWSAISDRSANGTFDFGAIDVTLVPITQTNLYWRYEWAGGINTTFWGGLCNGHGQVNAVLGDQSYLRDTFVFGSELQVPLTDRLAIFGQGNFIMPSDSGTVDSYLGLVYYPGGGSRHAYRSAFKPFQTVAAPTNFAVDLRRR